MKQNTTFEVGSVFSNENENFQVQIGYEITDAIKARDPLILAEIKKQLQKLVDEIPCP